MANHTVLDRRLTAGIGYWVLANVNVTVTVNVTGKGAGERCRFGR
ncbi:MAG: hypothetical protein ACI8Y4_002446 [Candidatus Poriferisodalaceae bacterium]|jgi:hypothetical protein